VEKTNKKPRGADGLYCVCLASLCAACPVGPLYSSKRILAKVSKMSASLIGRLGSSAFRLSTLRVSTSLAGSCFSPESAHRPFHHGVRRRGGTIFVATLPWAGPSGHANSPHPSSREGRHSTAWWSSKYPPIAFDPERTSSRCSFSGPSELAAISPDAVHNDGQASR
jgi:hypothetical protein